MNIRRARRYSAIAVMLGVLVQFSAIPGASAWSGDKKVYPAAGCTQYGGPFSALYYDFAGTVYNTHPSHSVYVNCPIVRDMMSSSTGIHHAYFFVANPRNSWCRLRLVQPYNNSTGRIIRSTVVDTTAGYYTFGNRSHRMFNMIDGNSDVVNDIKPRSYRTYYTLQCKLDPSSRLISYETYEADP